MLYCFNLEQWIARNLGIKLKNLIIEKQLSTKRICEILRESGGNPLKIILGSFEIPNYTYLGGMFDSIYYLLSSGKVEKVIFLSVYSVYKPKYDEAYSELDPLEPQNTIGSLSLIVENFLQYMSKVFRNTTFYVLRLFNVYGPFQGVEYVIPGIMNSILRSSIMYIGDKKKVRDFVYIDDLIRLIEKLLKVEAKSTYNVYNVGSGIPVSIDDLIKKIEKLTNKSPQIIFDPTKIRAEYDYDYAVADISKVKKEIGWEPIVSLDEGLKLTCNWLMGRGSDV